MDKYEYNIKAEQIVKLIGKKDFVTAAKIADGIDWKRVRNINMLTNVGSVYAEVERYNDAKEILMLAFDRAPIGRRLAYKLAEVNIQAGDFKEAEHYYDIFVDLAPRDTGKYELQYKLAKKKGEPVEKLVSILQEYKKNDFDEAWAYELAKMYHKAGMREECISECDEIILWFGEGEYVEKAMELKMLYMPLSPSQQEKYNKRYQPQMKYSEPIQAVPEEASSEQIPQKPVSVSLDMYNTANIQAVLAESMKELMPEEETETDSESEQTDAGQYAAAQNPTGQAEDIFGMTKDLRNVHKALSWNNMPYPSAREDAPMNLDEQIEGQMTIDEVLAMYNQRVQESAGEKEESLFRVVPKAEDEPEKEEQASEAEKAPVSIQPVWRETVLPKRMWQKETDAEPEVQSELPQQPEKVKTSEEARKEEEETEKEHTKLNTQIDKVIKEMEVTEKENVPVKQLSEEHRQTFAAFLHISGLEEQLAEIFDEAGKIGEEKDTSLFGNVLITGDHKSGKTTLAAELMKALNKTTNRKGRKIAKISGDRLNNKGIKETISHLIGADLLIERAGEMNRTTTQELLQAMAGYTGGMLVVLEDTQEGMQRLIAENPEVEVRFTHKLALKECEISEWVELAKQYAQEMDYGIDEMAVLALSAKIDALYAHKTAITMDDVKEVIDEAIEHSEKKNIKRLFETVFSRKYKDSDLTMLRENDFV